MYMNVKRYVLQSANADRVAFQELIFCCTVPTWSALILAAARAFSSCESHFVLTGQLGRMNTKIMLKNIVKEPSTMIRL
jgi:hypothetical protein